MAAVLRVKRRNDEEPLEAFVLACKRRKTDAELISEDENSLTTIVQFAGTVKTQNEDVVPHINNLRKEDLKESLKKHTASLASKLRAQTKEAQEGNRYKVVNYFRHLQETDKLLLEEEQAQEGKESDKIIHVVDIVSTSKDGELGSEKPDSDGKKGEESQESKEDPSYVYDLYYGVAGDFMVLDHLVDIHPLPQPVDFSTLRGPGEDDSEVELEEDEDSNDENNWRNDYPDSDHSVNEEDKELALEMDGIQIADDELSSDDEDERYLYDADADPVDIQLYGESYARYKYQRTKELFDEDMDPSGDEGDYYGDDSGDEDNEGDYGVRRKNDDDDEDPELRFM
ncbi:probable RNA polymerase II nuclear localization protein SLC7A6OS [Anabrus simplex]|uniref:probable RNA polymerase II nuclear localization protein SLC7A6OS n=1 Tax=Anabrus simplex TaxID=316456 RepID=UPI0035A390DF